jgi:hypothetical protein
MSSPKEEQLDKLEDNSTPSYPQRKKAGRLRNWKCRRQQDIEVPSAKMNIHTTGKSHQKRRNGGASVGYSALRWEICDMSAESRNSLIRRDVCY